MTINLPTFSVHGVEYPLSPSSQVLASCDPMLRSACLFAEFVLNKYVRTGFQTVCSARNISFSQYGNPSNLLIAEIVPFNPYPYLRSKQWKFPFLAVYRGAAEAQQTTNAKDATLTDLTVEWVLPSLTGREAEFILPFKYPVARTLRNRFKQNTDPDWTGLDGYNSRWGSFMDLQVHGYNTDEYLPFPTDNANEQIFMPIVKLDLKIQEEDSWNPEDFAVLEGFDLTMTNDDLIVTEITVDL